MGTVRNGAKASRAFFGVRSRSYRLDWARSDPAHRIGSTFPFSFLPANPAPYDWVPVGGEVMHLALCRQGRDSLYLALAGLVRDGLLDLEQAIRMGEMVLHGDAKRLYGFSAQKTAVGK